MADVVFRCEASPAIGMGHLMRCLSTAETLAWAGWQVAFAVSRETAAVPALAMSGYELRDSNQLSADWAVFDHYGIGVGEERAAREFAEGVAAFEDIPGRIHDADILLDPTPERQTHVYSALVPKAARILTGAAMAQIHPRWRRARANTPARRRGAARRIVISMGATDPSNVSSRVLTCLRESCPTVGVDVVLNSAARHLETVRAGLRAKETLHVDAPDLPTLLAQADLAIGAAGSSCFERALMGLPSIIVQLADNQGDLIGAFDHAGAAQAVSVDALDTPAVFGECIRRLAADERRLFTMSQRAAALVDGRGTQRLLAALAGEETRPTGAVRLRLAEYADADWLFALQCQPETRRFSLNPQAPTAEEHGRWMTATINDSEKLLCIVEANGQRVGMLRLDCATEGFTVSIAIDTLRQGQGLGGATLRLARRVVRHRDLIATVLPQNTVSCALFQSAGYLAAGPNCYRNAA
jgi:UDP-2,4-diacetamido-2,4,6-trideoxy-beta-L-altropyranose hydrolase